MVLTLDVAAIIVTVLAALIVGGIVSLVRLGSTVAQLHERVEQMQKLHLERILQVREELTEFNKRLDRYNDRLDSLIQAFYRRGLNESTPPRAN